MQHHKSRFHTQHSSAFTIVELLIVIVVIGVLAAITVVAFNGLQQRATTSALDNGLAATVKRLKTDFVTRDSYAASLADIQNSTESSGGKIQYQYTLIDSTSFCLTATLNGIAKYLCSSDNVAQEGAWSGHTAPSSGPISDPVVHVQSSSFTVTQSSGMNGVDVPISISYTLQPTDYVFVLFNSRNNTDITLRNNSSGISNIYTRSMGNSGYQTHTAFGISGLSGQATLTANACWATSCPYSGANVTLSAAYTLYVMRGLGSSPTVTSTYTAYGVQPAASSVVAPTAQSVNAGDVAVYSYVYYGGTLPTEGDQSSPSLTWTTDSTQPANHLGTAIATRHTYASANTSVQYQTTMPASGSRYHGSVLFTFK